ncbi:DUF2505 domain-containing protein [Demequina aurantiaca]|uniref:DUF2505 domain-containing protein n=1 Tax=Demequina aurantiaca TaxID=676200 RepID=UPI000783B1B5|nr:DUF2505 domain-containing protein [Demequina aurantiaca]
MKIIHQHTFHASLDRVIAMLADEEFAAVRANASGAAEQDVLVDGEPDEAFTVLIRRVVPSASIPAEFRSFVSKDLKVKYTEAWEPPNPQEADRVGTFAMEIVGAPGHVAGAIGLTPGDGTVEFLATGEISVSVPLIGSIIERAVAQAMETGFVAELAAADTWLAERA